MSTVAELREAFENVIARIPQHDRVDRKPVGPVIGMALPLGMDGVAPNRIMVFPLGEPPSNDDRKWKFTKTDLMRAAIMFKRRTEPMPILYDHGNDPAKGSKAAGWVDSVELEIDGRVVSNVDELKEPLHYRETDGLYANVRWTDNARVEIRSGEWGFRSPGWEGEEDPLGFVYAGPLNEMSLVNKPAIGGMAPVVASSQPSTATTQQAKETAMATGQEAAKKAAAMDKKGILEAIKAAFPGSDVFGDDVLAGLVSDALAGAPAADPMNPGAADSAAPAVPPAFASAEDEAKAQAATAAREKELTEAKTQLAAQEARIKALEATQLAGRIVTPNAADRKPGPANVPDAPSPGDHVGASLAAYDERKAATHQAAVVYRDKARGAGQNISYYDAVVAVTRKKTA